MARRMPCGMKSVQPQLVILALFGMGAVLYSCSGIVLRLCGHGSPCGVLLSGRQWSAVPSLTVPRRGSQVSVNASTDGAAGQTLALLTEGEETGRGETAGAEATSTLQLSAQGISFQTEGQAAGEDRPQQEASLGPGSGRPASSGPLPAEFAHSLTRSLAEAVATVPSKAKGVIVVSANFGYLDLVRNWFVSVDRFGYGRQVVFLAEEAQAFAALEREHPGQAVLLAGDDVEADAQSFGTDAYYKIVDRRPAYLLALLKLNVAVLYNDVDMVWLANPFPYFRGNYDAWLPSDFFEDLGEVANSPSNDPLPPSSHNLCTCFMYIRPTSGSMKLIRKWQQVLRRWMAASGTPLKNQPAFHRSRLLLTAPRSRQSVRVGMLPQRLFPSGALVFRNVTWRRQMQARGVRPAIIHNNWITGYTKKVWRFKISGLWYVAEADAASLEVLQREVEDDPLEMAVANATLAGELRLQ